MSFSLLIINFLRTFSDLAFPASILRLFHSFTQSGKNMYFLKDLVFDENSLSLDDAADLR